MSFSPVASSLANPVGFSRPLNFGGVTAFTRAPAQGSNAAGGTVVHDDIVVMEVMAATLDPEWWAAYRKQLERDFVQDEIVIRARAITRL
jgi:hypothetical protein